MRKILALFTLIPSLLCGDASSDLIIDDFTALPASKKPVESFSAPTEKHYVAFLRQLGLDSKHTIGGTRSNSINIKKGDSISSRIDTKAGTCRITYAPQASGWAFLGYYGGAKGERRQLGLSLSDDKFSAISIELSAAPSNGKLTVALYEGRKFAQHSLEIKGAATYEFPLDKLKKVDLKKIDGISVELKVDGGAKAQNFEFKTIYVKAKTDEAK